MAEELQWSFWGREWRSLLSRNLSCEPSFASIFTSVYFYPLKASFAVLCSRSQWIKGRLRQGNFLGCVWQSHALKSSSATTSTSTSPGKPSVAAKTNVSASNDPLVQLCRGQSDPPSSSASAFPRGPRWSWISRR